MTVLCLDTMMLVWGVQRHARPEQEEVQQRAAAYLDYLMSRDDVVVVVPMLAAMEFVFGFPEEEHDQIFATLSTNFRLLPFDQPCARIATRLYKSINVKEACLGGYSRQMLRIDISIAATAINVRAQELLCHDDQLRKQVGGLIRVRGVADMEVPLATPVRPRVADRPKPPLFPTFDEEAEDAELAGIEDDPDDEEANPFD